MGPQKGWTGPSCAGLVMLSEKGLAAMESSDSDSFTVNLKGWNGVMESYLKDGFAYYTTMPTDALATFREVMIETEAHGYDTVKSNAWVLGKEVREYMESKGFESLSAPGFQSPGVVVSHTDDAEIIGKFIKEGAQLAAGVPLMIDEPQGNVTFRIGLFGLDKMVDPYGTAESLKESVEAVYPSEKRATA